LQLAKTRKIEEYRLGWDKDASRILISLFRGYYAEYFCEKCGSIHRILISKSLRKLSGIEEETSQIKIIHPQTLKPVAIIKIVRQNGRSNQASRV